MQRKAELFFVLLQRKIQNLYVAINFGFIFMYEAKSINGLYLATCPWGWARRNFFIAILFSKTEKPSARRRSRRGGLSILKFFVSLSFNKVSRAWGGAPHTITMYQSSSFKFLAASAITFSAILAGTSSYLTNLNAKEPRP